MMQSDEQISSILHGWETNRLNTHLDDLDGCEECGEDVRDCDCAKGGLDPEDVAYDRYVDEQGA